MHSKDRYAQNTRPPARLPYVRSGYADAQLFVALRRGQT
jgi:hypothetical protein